MRTYTGSGQGAASSVRLNPQYIDFRKLTPPPNAGLTRAGEAGAQAVLDVRSRNAAQPIRSGPTNQGDSLYVILQRFRQPGRGTGGLHGLGGNDRLEGSANGDRLFGDEGDDGLYGRRGDDRLEGGDGADVLDGGRGEDRLLGQAGADTLTGGFDEDRMAGGPGDDHLRAVDGRRDVVDCGAGRDRAEVDAQDRVSGCEVVDRG